MARACYANAWIQIPVLKIVWQMPLITESSLWLITLIFKKKKSVLLIISFKKKFLSGEMAHICNPITLVTGGSDVQDYALIHSKFQDNLD